MGAAIRKSFEERGFLDPTRVFDARECADMLRRLREACATQAPLDWQKGWAATSPVFAAVAADDHLLALVTPLLGDDVLLWGASLVVRRPNQVHPWHTDIESSRPEGGTVSVWIGLDHTSALSSLIVVPGSHRFGLTLQQLAQQEGASRDVLSDERVAAWARARDSRSGVLALDTTNGDAVVFDGRLWHASHNRRRRETRHALLLQYATPDTPIRIPNFARLDWPFEFHASPKPPCLLVHGHVMETPNRIVPAPAAPQDSLPSLSSRVHALQLPLAGDPERGFRPHPLFRGSTACLGRIGCHVSVLDPGHMPHPPHRHDDEELLIVLDGEAELIVEDETTPESRTAPRHARAGDIAYYPAGFTHTIRNASHRPVTYLMFKWTGDARPERNTGGNASRVRHPHRVVSTRETGESSLPHASDGTALRQAALLDGETAYLRHLRAHLSVMPAGGGYPPHVDAYDIAIVMLDGGIDTLGERLGPYGVAFHVAGEPHALKNVGPMPARYIVFEFHSRHHVAAEPYDPRWSRRLWKLLRDPARLKAKIAQRLRG